MINATPFCPRRLSCCLAAALAAGMTFGPGSALAQAETGANAAPASIPLAGTAGSAGDGSEVATGAISLPLGSGRLQTSPGGSDSVSVVLPGAAEGPARVEVRPQLAAALWPVDGSRVEDADVVLRGENDSLDFDLFVPPGADLRKLTVEAVSSAFIHQGHSTLRAYVGNAFVGEAALESITASETVEFDLPPGTMTPGHNVVRIEADLAHRLYCGADASYDLWTRIDLGGSGVPARGGAPEIGELPFLAAASVARAEQRPIVVRIKGAEPTAEDLAQIGRDLASVIGGGLRFAAASTSADPGAPVIEIRKAATAAAAFRAGPGGTPILEIRAAEGDMPSLFAGVAPRPRQEVVPLPLDQAVAIGELGFPTTQIADSLWSESIRFELPADWLTTVKKRAILDLDFGHVAGLPTGSELRVRVNDQVIRLVPLDAGARLGGQPLEVRFDAGLLQAGRNVIDFEVSLPGAPADQPCIASADGRIEVRNTSTLHVPSSPSMHMPGLVHWMSTDGPIEIVTPRRATTEPGLEDLALVHELSAALRGEPGRARRDKTNRRLIVLRPEDLSRATFGDFGISSQAMLAALQPPRVALAATLENGPLDVVEASILGDIPGVLAERARKAFDGLQQLALPDPVAELTDWLGAARGQAILFRLEAASSGDAYLLLADQARLTTVAAALEGAVRWGTPLNGQVALLDWHGRWSTWADRSRLPVFEGEISKRNWQDVIGSFASSRPRLFVELLLGIALLSIVFANSYIAASRRQR